MINSIIVQFVSLVFLLLLLCVYFSKGAIDNVENRIYKRSIIINFFSIILDIFSIFTIYYMEGSLLNIIVSKLYLVTILFWILFLTIYIFMISLKTDKNITEEEQHKKNILIKVIPVFVFFCSSMYLFIANINFVNEPGKIYSVGAAVDFVYKFTALCFFVWFVRIIFRFKYIIKTKCIPIVVYVIFGIISSIIQQSNPEILLVSFAQTFCTFVMFFTIENPDVKMIKQLEIAREQADKANRAKTDFLSSMSHEIRTPLNAIVGFSDCIMDANDLFEAKANAKDIVNASQTLLEIVNGILDISKIEAGKIEIVNSKYNAPETFLELAKLITPKMHEKGLDFTYNIASDLPLTLFGDHANIKKIVTNLLSNACKYTDRGYVHYEVNCVNSEGVSKLIISVEDSGRGIKKDSIDKMFTKFQRLDEDRNTTIEGTGLGLAITKQLIELMGGRIIVHTVYGEGSKFTVVLNQKIEKEDAVKTRKVKTTLDLYNIRIMLVDDTPLNLKVASKLLEKFNANHIVTCDSGFECYERISKGEIYDLILLDDMMPKMSGVETLKKLKELPGFKIPTVALTANAISGMREKYLADGFDDYLAKPIEKDQLIQVVNQILGRNMTEELTFPEDKINRMISGPISPSVRDNDVVNVSEFSDENKNSIIPVEDNIEELLKEKLDRNYIPETVTLNVTPIEVNHIEEIESLEDVQPVNLVHVQDINVGVGNNLEVCDRSYLEKMGVDVNHALELLGDMEMYNMTISDFMSEVEEKWSRIVDYKNQNNMPDYAIEVHSLKSDCKYLGFMKLADISYQHELKSKENDSVFVNEHFKELEDEYNKVLDIAKKYVKYNNI